MPAISLPFLQNKQVQTKVSQFLAERLSEELNTYISLSSVNYTFFKRIQIRDLYIEDLNGDTLLFSELTKLRIRHFRPEKKSIEIRQITVENAFINFVIDSNRVINLRFITDRLVKPHVPPERKSRLLISSIDLIDTRFALSNMQNNNMKPGVNLTDLILTDLQISVENLVSYRDSVKMDIVTLSGNEKSGFIISQLASNMQIGKHHLQFFDTEIETGESSLHLPEISFQFENFKHFREFTREVDLSISSRESRISTNDLSFFVPQFKGMLDEISLDGEVNGRISDLKGDELVITFDENSTLAFDFIMIGLPEINNTFLDFNFKQLNTSVSSIEAMVNAGDTIVQQHHFPWINLGDLIYEGRFTGYPDNFVASGLLSTDLGRMIVDLSFTPDTLSGVSFNGHLRTDNFMLGRFLNQEEYVSDLDMDIHAEGRLYQGEIQAQLEGIIDTLEFYEYAYSNIIIDGEFSNKTFDGNFSISDPNIRMDFLGRMDFSGDVPLYNFTADVARVRPYYLNLPQDDPGYFASFLVETELSGRNIDELNGEIRLVNSLFEKSDAQVQIYNLGIFMQNRPDTASIQIRSEILDADISGKFK